VKFRWVRCRDVDAGTAVNLADGPLTAAGSWMRWESLPLAALNLLLVALVMAIVAVWSFRVDAPPVPTRTRHSSDDDGPYLP
jgi:hypothetical protein